MKKTICRLATFAPALLVLGTALSASASQTKYMTSFQEKGAAAVEGDIAYEPMDGGKKIKTSAIVSFIGQPNEIVNVLDQSWKTEAELETATITNCAENGGTVENVTVKAGTFKACKMHALTAEVEITKWTGMVSPTGMLRMDLKKKDIQTREELTEYTP
jgi:putative hemolysin